MILNFKSYFPNYATVGDCENNILKFYQKLFFHLIRGTRFSFDTAAMIFHQNVPSAYSSDHGMVEFISRFMQLL